MSSSGLAYVQEVVDRGPSVVELGEWFGAVEGGEPAAGHLAGLSVGATGAQQESVVLDQDEAQDLVVVEEGAP